jgi:anaerobic selenocysteine-containing dehydrogenase
VVPGYEKVGAIDDSREEFQIAGRTFHQARFPTASGRAKFHVTLIPGNGGLDAADAGGSPCADGDLRLMTIRSEGQFNTVVYEEEDIYRHQERRDVILMNRDDIERLELRPDQRVTVQSDAGIMRGILVREWNIRAGNAAMYYPEANLLVPARADPQSRTPAFKNVRVTVRPDETSPGAGPVQLAVPRRDPVVRRPLHAC